MDAVRNYLNNPGDAAHEDLSRDPAVLWIDWGEEDDAIVNDVEEVLKTGTLSGELRDAENALGYDVIIHYNGREHKVDYPADVPQRDITLIALNSIIRPAYELRFWTGSVGGDTLGFIVKPGEYWQALEQEFGPGKVRYLFAVIDKNSRMFEMEMEEVEALLRKNEEY